MICNILPILKGADQAMWNRVKVIPFESTFVKKLDKDKPDKKIFKADMNFSEKIPILAPVFAWYLLNWRMHYLIPKDEPEKVTNAVAKYKQKNDILSEFIDECITNEDKTRILSLVEVYETFKNWFRQGCPNQTIPPRIRVKDYLEKLWGPCVKGNWKGYSILSEEDKIANGDIVFHTT
jgi:phage/plasmid-associated DNA primase